LYPNESPDGPYRISTRYPAERKADDGDDRGESRPSRRPPRRQVGEVRVTGLQLPFVAGTVGMLLSILALAPAALLLSGAVTWASWTWLYRLQGRQ
jgi:hypothetical protein